MLGRVPIALRRSMSSSAVPNPLPAAFLRGGTSKGVFINRKYLGDRSTWDALFLRIMGSPDPVHGRQLDGMGGGVSSLSKVMVVGPPSAPGVDADYTFAQVGIRDATVDYAGNCGNLSSMIGAFAVDEGICAPRLDADARTGTVRAWNTNTAKEVRTTFPVTSETKAALDLEQVEIAGVPGKASQILLDFVEPAGARTGKLLPTGNATDSRTYSPGKSHTFSLVDATNPTVLVAAADVFDTPHLPPQETYAGVVLERIELIRQAGATAMGLDPSAQSQPKIVIVGVPSPGSDADIDVHALSMGVLHRAVPMTVGLCVGVAASLQGTVVHAIMQQARPEKRHGDLIRLRHPSGVVDVGAEFAEDGRVLSAKVVRTGRRLMHGAVWW